MPLGVNMGGGYLTIRPDMSSFNRELTRGVREAAARATGNVKVGVDFNERSAKTALNKLTRGLKGQKVMLDVEFNQAGARAAMNRLQRSLSGQKIELKVDIDRSALSQLSGLLGGGGGIGGGIAAASGGLSQMSLLLGAAAVSAGVLGGAIAVLPAVIGAVTGALGVLFLAIKPLADAMSAFGAVQDQTASSGAKSAKTTVSNARQIRAATQAITDAKEQQKRTAVSGARDIAAAEKNAASAQKAHSRAVADLGKAYKDARRELEDMNDSLKDSQLDAADASIAVFRAQERLNEVRQDGRSSAVDVEEAELGLAQAQQRQKEAGKDLARQTEDTAKANAGGAKGLDTYKNAVQKVSDTATDSADAEQKVTDAKMAAAQANADAAKRVTEAQQGLRDAQTQQATAAGVSTTANNKLTDALSKLSPAGLAFFEILKQTKPLMEALSKVVQDSFLPGLTPLLKVTMALFGSFQNGKFVLGPFGDVLKNTGETMGMLATTFANLLGTFKDGKLVLGPLGQAFVDIGNAGINFMKLAGPGLIDLFAKVTEGMGDVSKNVGPLLSSLGGLFSTIGDSVKQFMDILADPKAIAMFAQAFTDLGTFIKPLLPLVGQLIVGLSPLSVVFDVVGKVLQSIVDSGLITLLGTGIAGLMDAIKPLIPVFMTLVNVVLTNMMTILKPIIPIIVDLAKMLGGFLADAFKLLVPYIKVAAGIFKQLMPVFTMLWTALKPLVAMLLDLAMQVLTPLIPIISMVVQAMGDTLMKVLAALMPAFLALVDAVMSLLPALMPIIPLVVQLLMAFMPLITDVLLPILPLLASLVATILKDLMPIITRVIKVILDWVATLLKFLIPIITKVVGILVKVLQPTITAVFKAADWAWKNILLPVFKKIGDVVVWLVDKIFKPYLGAMKTVWSTVLGAIKTVWTTVLSPVFDAVKTAVGNVKTAFSKAVEGIKTIWDKLKEYARAPVGFVINTVYNNGIRKFWNNIAGKVGAKELPEMKFARGGKLPGSSGMSFRDDRLASSPMGPVALAGGEYIMNARSTKKYLPQLEAMNSSGTGGADGGYAHGGVPAFGLGGWLGDLYGKAKDGVRGALGGLAEKMASGAKGVLNGIPYGNSGMGALIKSVPNNAIDKIVSWVKGDDKAHPQAPAGGGGGVGGSAGSPFTPGYRNQIATLRNAGFNLKFADSQLTGGEHAPGSNHYIGRAIDIGVGTNGQGTVQKVWDYLVPNYAKTSKELYWAQKSVNYRHGQPIGPTDKTNHIHWAYGKGGLFPAGGTPRAYDNGGPLPSGFSTVYNGTGKVENVQTSEQQDQIVFLLNELVRATKRQGKDIATGVANAVNDKQVTMSDEQVARSNSRTGGGFIPVGVVSR